MGLGEKLDLRWVQSIEPLHGEAVDVIRSRMLDGPRPVRGASTAMVVGGQAGLAVGQFALAWSFVKGIKSRRGLICTMWMHDAVHVLTLDGEEWLMGSRDPERLAATIREGVAEAKAAARAEPDPVEAALARDR